MRAPARIDRILAAVRKVWVESPDLRLAQLIVNAGRSARPCPQVFYIEDDRLERGLAEYLGSPGPPPAGDITVTLPRERAMVLLDLLERLTASRRAAPEHPADATVLVDLREYLRGQVTEAVQPDWNYRLTDARKDIAAGFD